MHDVNATTSPADLAAAPVTHSRQSTYWLDWLLGGLGTAMGWMSLWYPFGRDQGLYHYVARQWWVEGAVPYRDVLDHKTPGIYMLHALSIALFGENMWGIRVLELVGTLLTALLAATFSAPRGEKILPGVRGASVLAMNLLFYGQLIFWDLSQSELWYALLGLCSVWAARRFRSEPWAQLAAGAFAGAALVMKPPALWFVLIAVVVMLLRVRESRTRWLVRALLGVTRFSLGGAATVLPVLGYFAAVGAMPAMLDIVVRSNSYYAQHETDVKTLAVLGQKLLEFYRIFPWTITPIALALLASLGFALRQRDRAVRDRHLLAAALVLAGLAATIMQLKFYVLHWVVLIAPAVVVMANLAADAWLWWPRARSLAPLIPALALLLCWAVAPHGRKVWVEENTVVIRYLRGDITRDEFNRFFALPTIGFWYEWSERVGLWLRDHSTPDDYIAVRGFQPEIYAIAQRQYPGRFFWTTFLTSATRGDAEMIERWHREEAEVLARTPPRYAMTLNGIGAGHDSVVWWERLGYVQREVMGPYIIMERVPPPPEPRGTP